MLVGQHLAPLGPAIAADARTGRARRRYSHGSEIIGNITCSVRPAAASSSARACAFIRPSRSSAEAQRAPAHRRVFLHHVIVMMEIGQRLVAADIERAEDHRALSRRIQHIAIQALLALALRACVAETRNWNSVRKRPMPSAPVTSSAPTSSRSPALTISSTRTPSFVIAGCIAQLREFRLALLAELELALERLIHVRRGSDEQSVLGHIHQDEVALVDEVAHIAHPAEHRNAHRARNDDHVRCERAFLKHHALQAPPVIFEQLRRAEIARDEDRILPQSKLRRRAELARDDAQQAVGEILQIVHPVGNNGSSIWRIRIRVRCCTRSIAASAVRPLSIASLMRRDQPSS
jgi:hypothetical protein